jgi:hypothetical protein
MSWRAGIRESIKRPDALARDPHPLTVAHREAWDRDAREHFRKLLDRNA